jgi:DNA-binding MarR family transcriptional regulator
MEEVKGDIGSSEQITILGKDSENSLLRQEVAYLRNQLSELKGMLSSIMPTNTSANAPNFPTDMPSKTSSFPVFSTGNEGVPTDRQTDNIQTIRQSLSVSDVFAKANKDEIKVLGIDALDNMNSLLSELKIKFRMLTSQEFKVFSAIYIFEQEQKFVDYKLIADKLHLTESSIRDYVMKMERKGIPIFKEKINNKKVVLHVRPELREFVPLDVIMKVREPIFR